MGTIIDRACIVSGRVEIAELANGDAIWHTTTMGKAHAHAVALFGTLVSPIIRSTSNGGLCFFIALCGSFSTS